VPERLVLVEGNPPHLLAYEKIKDQRLVILLNPCKTSHNEDRFVSKLVDRMRNNDVRATDHTPSSATKVQL
jgi:hypothetical protein